MSNKIKLFKQKAYKSVRVGGWLFEWFFDKKHPERSLMRVLGESGLFDLKIKANSHVFGYLLAAAEQNRLEQLHGWITLVYVPAMAMTQDQGLTDDISKSIGKWMKRRDAEAKTNAKNTTESEELASQAFMEDVVARSKMSKKEAKKASEDDKAILRDLLNEDKEGEE